MEDFLLFFLAGMLGGDIAKKILDGDKDIKIPYISIYCICFTITYIIFLFISLFGSLNNGYEINFRIPCIVAFSLGSFFFLYIILGLKLRKHIK